MNVTKDFFLHWSMFENPVIVNAVVSVSTFVATDLVLDFFLIFCTCEQSS